MFTDTKNLTQNSANLSEWQWNSSNCTQKSKGKFHKVLKPLLRLVKLKSTKSSIANIAHPNNIHLNNTNNCKDISELPSTFLEDYAAVIRKVTTTTTTTVKEQEPLAPHDSSSSSPSSSSTLSPSSPSSAVDDATADTAVISSASIEKSTTTTCNGCSYGRNCQHEQFHYDYDKTNHSVGPIIEMPAIENLTDVPVHFIRTDNGTFFWTAAQEKIDDDLLQAWLCHSFLQLPTEAVFY